MKNMDAFPQSEPHINKSHPGRTYRPDIDGLRAVAILSVVAYHAGIRAVGGGFVGVDIFLVISGYLITSVICDDILNGRFSVARFYARRAKRILPALFAVLLACYVVAAFLLSPVELKTFANNAFATILSSSNILFWLKSGYFAANSESNPLLMTWSLGVEEQFYLFFPLFMLFVTICAKQKRSAAVGLVLLASLALSVWGTRNYPTATFYLLPTRAWELAVGALIAIREAEKPGAWRTIGSRKANTLSGLAVVFLAIPVFFYNRDTIFPGLAAILPVAGAALLVITPGSWLNRTALSSKPIVFIGLVSYSWYLWHWPLLSFARILSGQIGVWTALTIVLMSFLLAVATHRFVEQPFRKSISNNIIILQRYAALSLAMVIPLIAIHVSDGWPARFPGLSEVEASGLSLQADPCLAGYGQTTPSILPECVPQSPSGVPGVALLGDSHAAALAGALRNLGKSTGFTLSEFTKSSCPALVNVTRLMPSHPWHDRECAAFNARVIEQLQRESNIQVVILAGFWSAPFTHEAEGERFIVAGQPGHTVTPAESRENLKRGLQDTVRVLQDSGKRVIVLKDNPIFDFDPVGRVRGTFIKPRKFLAKLLEPSISLYDYSAPRKDFDPTYDDEASAIIDAVAAADEAVTFDLKKTLCDERSCYFYDGKSLLYEDSQHLSLAGAERGLAGLDVTKPMSR